MIARLLFAFIALSATTPASAEFPVDELKTATDEVLDVAIEHYKWFHRYPELSLKETRTAQRLTETLKKLGLEVRQNIGGTGLVAILRSTQNPHRRVVLYRADMDGLPITEKTRLSYASKNNGVMHACGHDTHMASAIGALSILAKHRDRWQGTVLFVGQPAEELGMGARMMLADPRFKAVLKETGKPGVAVALHDAADLAAGQVSLLAGYAHANVDSVDITIYGRGGHGARPDEAIDPIVIASDVVMSLQTIVSRRIPGNEPGVITVGQFTAGTKHNIIPDRADLKLTVRSYSDSTRELLLGEIKRVTENVARAHRAPQKPTITVLDEFTPASYNDPVWTERLRASFTTLLGKRRVETHTPTMGGEDFGRFSKTLGIPGVMWKLGGAPAKKFKRTGGKGMPGLHSPFWAPDPRPTVRTGILTATRAILTALNGPAQ